MYIETYTAHFSGFIASQWPLLRNVIFAFSILFTVEIIRTYKDRPLKTFEVLKLSFVFVDRM